MKNSVLTLILTIPCVALIVGCVIDAGPHPPALRPGPNLEEAGGVVLLDSWSRQSITCTTVKYSCRPDGRLVISANIVNRRNFQASIETSCTFQDQHGVGVGDETPYERHILSPNETKTVAYVARDDRAKSASIRVKKAE